MGGQSGVRRDVCRSHRGFPVTQHRRPGAFARLPPSGNSSCCIDIMLWFSTAGFARDGVKKRQAPHLAQKSSRQLAPCLHPCCAVRYVTPFHHSPTPSTKPRSLNPALVAASNKTGFPDYTHSSHFLSGPALFHSLPLSLLQTNILSLPLAGAVCSCSLECCRLSCGACSASKSSSLLPKKWRAGINRGPCLPQNVSRALTAQWGRLGRKAELQVTRLLPFAVMGNVGI